MAENLHAVSLKEYAANNAGHFTHTGTHKNAGNFWNRKLTCLFTHTAPSSGPTFAHPCPHPDDALVVTTWKLNQ